MTDVTPDVTIGIDIGTTSVKAVAADGDGTVLARTRVPHEVRIPTPRRLEHDAAAAWVDGPRKALQELGHPDARAVAVAAMVPSLTAVDGDGRPIAPGLLYGDERGGGPDHGRPPGENQEPLGFLRWLAEQAPDAAGYWSATAVANHALSGDPVIDLGSAFSLAPLFAGDGWDADLLAEVGVEPGHLPRVGGLGDAAAETHDGMVLASGLVDAPAEQLVAGATNNGDVLVMCGTTMLTWMVVGEDREVDGLWTVPHIAGQDQFLLGGPSNAGGLFLNWVRRLLPDAEPPTDPSSIPVWAPYPRGERTPLHDPDRRAGIHDLDLTHGPGAVLQAAYEAAGFVVRHHLDLAAAGGAPKRIVATGGGTQDPRWMQALADCTGLPVDVSANPDGAALGVAFLARMAAGLEEDLAGAGRWAATDRVVEPRPDWQDAAAGRYDRFRTLDARTPPG